MYLFTDQIFIKDGILNVTGWASSDDGQKEASFKVFAGDEEIPFTLIRGSRPDVGYMMFRKADFPEAGYFLQIPLTERKKVRIQAFLEEQGQIIDEASRVLDERAVKAALMVKSARALWTREKFKDTSPVYKVLNKIKDRYNIWFKNFRSSPAELEEKRNTHFAYEPLISILVPVYRTPLVFLRDMLGSVSGQVYPRFELCIVNADPSDEAVSAELQRWQQMDDRIRVRDLPENLSIADNTNEALKMAKGEYIALLDHDDCLEYDALWEMVKRINEKPETELLYSDEDKIGEKSNYFFFPNLKPDFNRDLLYANNYICHFLCVRRSLAVTIGGFDPEFNGAQDYDFILRCIEQTDKIEHISRVLYHWRSYGSSTSKSHKNKGYAEDAGRRALNAHFQRMGYHAVAHDSSIPGSYVTRFFMDGEPLVSVLIPSKDHTDDLDVCVQSLLNKCTYKNLEIIIIENNSTEEETFAYYEKIEQQDSRVKVVYWPGTGFNFSAINNYGFSQSSGEYILLLNNDVEVITEDMFESMLGYFSRPDVGMVGCKLLYRDNTIQHAGVLIGGGGLADHLFKGYKDSAAGYMCRAMLSNDVSAVTAACCLMPRKIYEEVGGLEEDLAVAFNDVDLCLKVRASGYTIVYDAQAKLYHYESKSRGSENTPEKYLRFSSEMSYLSNKWKEEVAFNDPNYNPNLSYQFNYIPDVFAVPDRILDQGKTFVAYTADEAACLSYLKAVRERKGRKGTKK